ncbi:MAG: zinc ribbon domain-containing protein [Acutalibacteraceae bacterium]|nr:zinc ribbon domain-containing protein [Acutalibacteraceae bacterium]
MDNLTTVQNEEIENIFCPHCGYKNVSTSIICTNCNKQMEYTKCKKNKKVFFILVPILIVVLVFASLFLTQKTQVTIDKNNFDEYFETEILIEDYNRGLPVTFSLYGISNYTSSTAKVRIVVKPKKKFIFTDVKVSYDIDAFLWHTDDFSKMDIEIISNEEIEKSFSIKSVDMQLTPASEPSEYSIDIYTVEGELSYYKFFN